MARELTAKSLLKEVKSLRKQAGDKLKEGFRKMTDDQLIQFHKVLTKGNRRLEQELFKLFYDEFSRREITPEGKQIMASNQKVAGSFDSGGELSLILLDLFCDEFGYNGISMKKFIAMAHKKIKKDMKHASFQWNFDHSVKIPLGSMMPRKSGIELCLNNMSNENFGILVGYDGSLSGTDC